MTPIAHSGHRYTFQFHGGECADWKHRLKSSCMTVLTAWDTKGSRSRRLNTEVLDG